MGCATSTFSMVRGFWGPWNTAAFISAPFLGQQISDENTSSRHCHELHARPGAQRILRRIPPAERRRRVRDRSPVNLQHAIDEVHDPEIGEARAGVETALVISIEGQTRLGDLDDER